MDVVEKTNLLEDEACKLPTKIGEGFYLSSLLGVIGGTSAPKGATRDRHEVGLRKLHDAYGASGTGLSGLLAETGAIRLLVGTASNEAVKHMSGEAITRIAGSDIWLQANATETAKATVASASDELPVLPRARRRKAAPKAVALLEHFKDVPSVDPHLFRADIDRILDPGL